MTKFSILVLNLLFFVILSCSDNQNNNPVVSNGNDKPQMQWLHVEGSNIVNESGKKVLLYGVNRSGLEYDKTGGNGINESEIDYICQEWNASIIRVPFNQEWIMTDEAYNEKLDAVVNWIKDNGVYVLLDLQWQNTVVKIPNIPDTNAISMWQKLANRYQDEPAVLYDIHNETHDIDFASWRNRASEIIEAMREVHDKPLIFVSGMNWASNLEPWVNNPLPYQNIVYAVHVYPWWGGRENWDTRFGNYTDQIPMFCGELGGHAEDIQWGKELIRYLNRREIGWCAWSWVDDPHLTLPEDKRTPTEFGQLVKDYLERYTVLDTMKNSISNLDVQFIGSDKASVVWETQWESDSKVFYGETQTYSDSIYAAALLTNHLVKLENLIPNTEYHFKVVSVDEFGFRVESNDSTFRTEPD